MNTPEEQPSNPHGNHTENWEKRINDKDDKNDNVNDVVGGNKDEKDDFLFKL